ncbi:MAG: hypothetical protein V1863_05150 [Candidatus Omnitrophota bacterium]
MNELQNNINREIKKFWPKAQKSMAKINRDLTKAIQRGEKDLRKFYKDAKKKTETVVLKARREELYYELGKSVAPLLTSEQSKNKNILRISSDLRLVNKKLRSRA